MLFLHQASRNNKLKQFYFYHMSKEFEFYQNPTPDQALKQIKNTGSQMLSSQIELIQKTLEINFSENISQDPFLTEVQEKTDRKSTRLNSSHRNTSRMPSSA